MATKETDLGDGLTLVTIDTEDDDTGWYAEPRPGTQYVRWPWQSDKSLTPLNRGFQFGVTSFKGNDLNLPSFSISVLLWTRWFSYVRYGQPTQDYLAYKERYYQRGLDAYLRDEEEQFERLHGDVQ